MMMVFFFFAWSGSCFGCILRPVVVSGAAPLVCIATKLSKGMKGRRSAGYGDRIFDPCQNEETPSRSLVPPSGGIKVKSAKKILLDIAVARRR